mmetsp:Transcript_13205/g.19788  ORF Transcript_13205/g.19788 Transcript_13205/m.19788 type:complete len:203 (-) Transcript_13205:175-783(-)
MSKNISHGFKIKIIIMLHPLSIALLSVRLESVGKIQYSTGMAAIHDRSDEYSLLHGDDEGFEEVVVTDLTIFLEIEGDECFVVPISFIIIIVTKFASMTRIMAISNITRLTITDKLLISIQNINLCRVIMNTIIQQNGHIVLSKPMHIHQILLHIQNIIMTSRQFPILTNIIDSNKNSPLGTMKVIRCDIKFGRDVEFARRG